MYLASNNQRCSRTFLGGVTLAFNSIIVGTCPQLKTEHPSAVHIKPPDMLGMERNNSISSNFLTALYIVNKMFIPIG